MQEKDSVYKQTLNLPHTTFPMKANLAQREPLFLERWGTEKLYEAIRKKRAHAPKFILHDGPPYANGHIHIGHALNKILKDIIVRYRTMRGYNACYVPGWDCHGLPIEHALFKDLGMSKHQIDQISFRKKAREYAQKFIDIQREEFIRLGVMGEWQNPYLTMNYAYQASIIEAFRDLYMSGYIYKGEKPIHWCSLCETALAEAELEYLDKISDAIYVRVPVLLEESKDASAYRRLQKYKDTALYMLIWTTTPWTLPANVAIAVHPRLDYALYHDAGKNEGYLCALDLVDKVKEKLGRMDGDVVERFKGHELEKVMYAHPFLSRTSPVVSAEYVSNEDGCGCVHIAPGHGEDDYFVGKQYGLEVLSPVNDRGEFTHEFPQGQGKRVLQANEIILELLTNQGHLMAHEKMTHSYPHCWRCKKPVIFRATKQWFLRIEHDELRKRLVDAVNDEERIQWVPAWGKNRMLGMLEARPDWCLSRQRYWGVPIPIVYCTKCEQEYITDDMIETLLEAVEKEGADVWFKMDTAQLVGAHARCKCGNDTFKKEQDILDVWFDSGVSHRAVLKNNQELDFPCDVYLEGSDQHRGWFQTSLITSMALEDVPPFKAVITHGFTVDGEGKKMSKSAGNVVAPQNIMKNYGADILRLWVSSCDISQDVRISDDIMKQMADAYRKMRNTMRYLLSNLYDFDPSKDRVAPHDLDAIDQWAIGKCAAMMREVTDHYEQYRFHHIYRLIYNFCVVEMSSFYLDVLKDRMYTAKANGRERRSSQTAMFYIVHTVTKMLAPILPFTCDELWASFPFEAGVGNVHLADWPKEEYEAVSEQVLQEWDLLRELRSYVNPFIERLREKGEVGSSLEAQLELLVADKTLYEFLTRYARRLSFVFIVSAVTLHQVGEQDMKGSLVTKENGTVLFGIIASKAAGLKCERCWNYSKDVGEHEVHKGLCPKCIDAIS